MSNMKMRMDVITSVNNPHLEDYNTLQFNRFYSDFGKRAFDLLLCLALLPLIAAVLVPLWAWVKMDGGPGFYVQERVGKNGRLFKCWKLRTMVVDAERVLRELCDSDPDVAAEWDLNQKLSNDPRVTRVGRLLRATSLDELPQIWNVLLGEMSFVGPRPFMTSQKIMYCAAGGESYFHVRPGITGPWQIDGRGATTFVERIRFDDEYLKNLSFRSDVCLILRTVGVVFNRTGH